VVSNLEHLRRQFLGIGQLPPRFLGVCRPLNTVLFYTWLGAYTAAMPRKLVWIENQNFQGFGCSECNWMFKPASALVGGSLDEMKQRYEAQRDKEFAAHVCVKHLRGARPKTE